MALTNEKRIYDTFDYLHTHAELSWEEKHTTVYIKNLLEQAGCRVRTFDDCTGVIGDIGNIGNIGNMAKGGSASTTNNSTSGSASNGGASPESVGTAANATSRAPLIAIRADIDALWQEVDGNMQANHSCGHDAHMTMVLGTLWKLQQEPEVLNNVGVRFIFQPAEEVGTGALKLAEKGVVDDVDFLYGIHLRPVQEAANGFASPAIVHGATHSLEFEIRGDDAHGARPHLTHNAIEVGHHILNALQTIHLDPRVPHSIKVTRFIAGGKNTNIIPGKASLAIDMRAQTNKLMTQLKQRAEDILRQTEALFDTEIVVTEDYGIAAAEVHEEAQAMAQQAIANALGEEKVIAPIITPGGDDFHFYTLKKPHLKATMVGLGCDLKPGLHHPYMHFDRKALFNGIDVLTEIVKLHAQEEK